MLDKVRKIKLIIDGTGNKGWIGGLYYRKYILFSLLTNEAIAAKVSITVVTEKEHLEIFSPFRDQISIKTISYRSDRERKVKLILLARCLGAEYLFPSIGKWGTLAGCRQIDCQVLP